MEYMVIGTLVAAAVTIIPKVLPLYFLRGKTFNKKMMTFFKIVPYTSMTILILKYVFESDCDMFLPTIFAVIASTIAAYLTENMVITVIVSIFSTIISLSCCM